VIEKKYFVRGHPKILHIIIGHNKTMLMMFLLYEDEQKGQNPYRPVKEDSTWLAIPLIAPLFEIISMKKIGNCFIFVTVGGNRNIFYI